LETYGVITKGRPKKSWRDEVIKWGNLRKIVKDATA